MLRKISRSARVTDYKELQQKYKKQAHLYTFQTAENTTLF